MHFLHISRGPPVHQAPPWQFTSGAFQHQLQSHSCSTNITWAILSSTFIYCRRERLIKFAFFLLALDWYHVSLLAFLASELLHHINSILNDRVATSGHFQRWKHKLLERHMELFPTLQRSQHGTECTAWKHPSICWLTLITPLALIPPCLSHRKRGSLFWALFTLNPSMWGQWFQNKKLLPSDIQKTGNPLDP